MSQFVWLLIIFWEEWSIFFYLGNKLSMINHLLLTISRDANSGLLLTFSLFIFFYFGFMTGECLCDVLLRIKNKMSVRKESVEKRNLINLLIFCQRITSPMYSWRVGVCTKGDWKQSVSAALKISTFKLFNFECKYFMRKGQRNKGTRIMLN